MEFLITNRRAGKTHALITAFLQDPDRSYILCPTEDQAAFVRQGVSRRSEGFPDEPLRQPESRFLRQHIRSAHTETLRGLPQDSKVYVDNLESLLFRLLGVQPDVVTATGIVTQPSDYEAVTYRSEFEA
jgi:hypothetical protein